MKLLIGGQALLKLGSSRSTNDTDFLIDDKTSQETFIFDRENNIDYVNTNGHKFFAEIAKMEAKNKTGIASPKALLELKAFSLVQHCINRNWNKANDAEFDMKFLVINFGLKVSDLKIVKKYITLGQYNECVRVIESAKK